MGDLVSRLLLARLSAGFMLLAGVLGAGRAVWLETLGTDTTGLLIVSGVAVAVGMIAGLLPWNRLPGSTLVSLALLSLGLIGANGYLDFEDVRINAIYYLVVFMWAGIALPRWSSFILAPAMAVSYAAPLITLERTAELMTLSILLLACLFVGETARWLTSQVSRVERQSQRRADKMAALVEATLDLATCQKTGTLTDIVAANVTRLYAGEGSMVLLWESGRLVRAGWAGWPTPVSEKLLRSVTAEIHVLARAPAAAAFEPDRFCTVAEILDVPAVDVLPIQGSGEPLGVVLVAFASARPPLDEFTQYVVRTLATQAGLGIERLHTAEMLREESLCDPLTQIGNRRCALAALEVLKEGDAVAIVDLDHFKLVNDTFGHAAGDKVLRTIADFLRASVRDPDAVFRYGGEEFLIVLAGVGAAGLRTLERIQSAWRRQDRATTFSAGIAVCRAEDPMDAILARADGALYEAKRAGRNRVFAASDPA